MAAEVTSRKIMVGTILKKRMNMMRAAPPLVTMAMKMKKATQRTLTKITTRTRKNMASALIPAMKKKKRTKANGVAGRAAMAEMGIMIVITTRITTGITIRIITRILTGTMGRIGLVSRAVQTVAVTTTKTGPAARAHRPVASVRPQVGRVHPQTGNPPEEVLPLWTPNAAGR